MPTPFVAPDEHSDFPETATLIGPGSMPGRIDPPDDLDYFRIFAEAGASYTAEVVLDTHPDSVLTLYDRNFNYIQQNDDGGVNRGSRIQWTAEQSGDYFVEVRSYNQSSHEGTYTLLLSEQARPPDDHGNSFADATSISTLPNQIPGSIDYSGDVDYCSFQGWSGREYTIEVLLSGHPDTYLTLYDGTNGLVLAENDDASGLGNGSRIIWISPRTGDYFLEVRSYSTGTTGAYTLALTEESSAGLTGSAGATASAWDFTDDFGTDLGLWVYSGSAQLADEGYVTLTEARGYALGTMWLDHEITQPFITEFRYKAGGGSRGDGFVFMFYKDKGYDAEAGGCLGFGTGSSCRGVPGFGIEFDSYSNSGSPYSDPSANHIALVQDSVTNHLAYADDPRTEDNVWHDVRVTVGE